MASTAGGAPLISLIVPPARVPSASRSRPRPAARWFACLASLALAGAPALGAGTVACWHFDEPGPGRAGAQLRDAGPSGFDLVLGAGAVLAPGRRGGALEPRAGAASPAPPGFVARTAPSGGPAGRPARPRITDTRLNLGPGAWTVEAWIRLLPGTDAEGILLEIGTADEGADALHTRLSAVPGEEAFCVRGLAPLPAGPGGLTGRRVEWASPEGPPGGVAMTFTATLAGGPPLPRARWLHLAVVYDGGEELRLFLDGRPAAAAAATMLALPRTAESYLSVGSGGRGERPFPGSVDDLRISDHAVYTTAFSPPESVTQRLRPPRPSAARSSHEGLLSRR